MTDELPGNLSENIVRAIEPQPETVSYDLDDPSLYINRELALLEFQRRVLDEARDPKNPLLERIKFLAIVGSNLEEFFMVRVGGLHMQTATGMLELSIDGMHPAQQLAEIRKISLKLMQEARDYLNHTMVPALKQQEIHLLGYRDLNAKQRESADQYFNDIIFPVLTPLAYDPGHPFPHISNLSLNLAVFIKDQEGNRRFARVKVPSSLPALVPLKRSSGATRRDGSPPRSHYFVWLVDLITANLSKLFPGMEVVEAYPFHVTRNADFQIRELEASDLLDLMEANVRRRRFGRVVRLVITPEMPREVRIILQENLRVHDHDVYVLEPPLVLSPLMQLMKIDRYDLKDRPFAPVTPAILRNLSDDDSGEIFAAIRRGNILLHHPYDSFAPVINFLRSAARDPDVLAIKQTLYRVGHDSPVVAALQEAAREYNKQVAVLVELKARFDEESNIGWAKMLEQEGVHVTYGLLGLKTHSKIALVVRREGDRIRRYVHLGTGNYNHQTATVYEDLSMFTCDDEIGADATDLFNYLTGYSNKVDYRKLLVAPINLRQQLEQLIRNEIALVKKGKPGYMILKANAIVDKPMTALLYEASQAGVKIDLIIRGMCSLRPGIKGLSHNIRVISVVGRFLEHSRIYYFHNGGEERIYMGSADLMPRNLNDRVELVFPIEDPRMIRQVRDDILSTYLNDNVKARIMQPDGSFIRMRPDGKKEISAQDSFIQLARLLNP